MCKGFPTRSRILIKISRTHIKPGTTVHACSPSAPAQRWEMDTDHQQKILSQLAWLMQKQTKRYPVSSKVDYEYSLCPLTSKLSHWHVLAVHILYAQNAHTITHQGADPKNFTWSSTISFILNPSHNTYSTDWLVTFSIAIYSISLC